ncbi:MAG TPA: hypothetical protein VEI27_02960 [Dehalococcoidales bacterium]|nr:hypothetical protein [Dehalococcoidales bacterium]
MKMKMNLKFGRTVLLSIGLGILVIITVSLWYYHSQQVAEQQQLIAQQQAMQNQLKNSNINDLKADKQNLADEIGQAQLEYTAIISSVTTSLDSIQASNTILSIAQGVGVQITNITISDTYSTTLNKVKCAAMPVNTVVKGTLPQLNQFVSELKSGFPESFVENADFTIPSSATKDSTPTLNLDLIVYTYGAPAND